MVVLNTGLVKMNDFMIAVDNDGFSDGKCSFKGTLANIFSPFVGYLAQHNISCTAREYSKLGNLNTETNEYDGALGDLQKGVFDYNYMAVYYPLNDPNQDFVYDITSQQETMTMLTVYDTNTSSHSNDVLGMFTAAPYGVWIGYILSYLVFMLITFIGARLLQQNISPYWMTTCAFLDQDNYPTNCLFISTLSTVIMVPMFFMLTYATNSMGTELVTSDPPVTLTSYDEIIERNAKIALVPSLVEFEMFEAAKKGTIQYELFHGHRIAADIGPDGSGVLRASLFKQEVALVARPIAVRSSVLFMMALGGWPSTYRAYIGTDSKAKSYINAFLHSKRLKGTRVEKAIGTGINRFVEHGLGSSEIMDPVMFAQQIFGEDLGGLPSHVQMVTTKIEMKSGDVIPIGWKHVRILVVKVITLMITSLFILIAELVVHMIPNVQVKRERKLFVKRTQKQVDKD